MFVKKYRIKRFFSEPCVTHKKLRVHVYKRRMVLVFLFFFFSQNNIYTGHMNFYQQVNESPVFLQLVEFLLSITCSCFEFQSILLWCGNLFWSATYTIICWETETGFSQFHTLYFTFYEPLFFILYLLFLLKVRQSFYSFFSLSGCFVFTVIFLWISLLEASIFLWG